MTLNPAVQSAIERGEASLPFHVEHQPYRDIRDCRKRRALKELDYRLRRRIAEAQSMQACSGAIAAYEYCLAQVRRLNNSPTAKNGRADPRHEPS